MIWTNLSAQVFRYLHVSAASSAIPEASIFIAYLGEKVVSEKEYWFAIFALVYSEMVVVEDVAKSRAQSIFYFKERDGKSEDLMLVWSNAQI